MRTEDLWFNWAPSSNLQATQAFAVNTTPNQAVAVNTTPNIAVAIPTSPVSPVAPTLPAIPGRNTGGLTPAPWTPTNVSCNYKYNNLSNWNIT